MNKIPWTERVGAISVNPEMASLDDIAQMAADLQNCWMSDLALNDRFKCNVCNCSEFVPKKEKV